MKAAPSLPDLALGPSPGSALRVPALTLEQLRESARGYGIAQLENRFVFDEQTYVRRILHWEPSLEIVLLCWSGGQSSSIHDHRGSNCVTRVLAGRFRERLFREDEASGLYLELVSTMLEADDISGVDGQQIHQITNVLVRGRGALLNFYSPAFSPQPRPGTGRHLAVARP